MFEKIIFNLSTNELTRKYVVQAIMSVLGSFKSGYTKGEGRITFSTKKSFSEVVESLSLKAPSASFSIIKEH